MKKSLWTLVLLIPMALQAQTSLPLKDLSFWQNTNKTNWQITGDAQADLAKHGVLTLNPGSGILVNMPDKTNKEMVGLNSKITESLVITPIMSRGIKLLTN